MDKNSKTLIVWRSLVLSFFIFFKVIAILVPEESSYFSDHHSEISRPNSFAFGRKLQKLTDFIDMVVTTNILRV